MDRISPTCAPRTIGRYQLVSLIAEGDASSVYKAHDPSTGVEVAIKYGNVALAKDAVLLKRFERQFQVTSNLHHPNIIRGLDFGWHDARPYIVLEFVDGENLWARIDRHGRLPEAEAVDYIAQIAEGLHAAHTHGIVHRDIKPDKILLTKTRQAKLAGLGLGDDQESDCESMRPSRRVRIPNFTAPEQFDNARTAGVRCDIYSLGATLFMALTGQVPFGAPTLSAVLKKKLADDLISPRKLVPTLSAHIDWAVRRALMSDPELRHASCLEFIAALTAVSGCSEARTSGKSGRPDRQEGNKESSRARERRAAERLVCARPVYCTISQSPHNDVTANQQQWDAQIHNLSTNGIGLLLSRRFEPGSALMVHLKSNNGQTRRTREILVIRIEPTQDRGWFLAGKLTKSLTREEMRGFLESGATPRPVDPAAAPHAEAPCLLENESATQESDKPAYIGSYEVLETIGSGATATVYKGRNPQTDSVVAIKVSHGFMDLDPEALERFKREFTAINQLRHPHLVRALAMGQDRKRGIHLCRHGIRAGPEP